ncbi:MAG: helix-turn-helix domain-containing protein [Clostridia bacterium]|nr:helix-turn-helix domain-containing protein [Clostridia bacterium]
MIKVSYVEEIDRSWQVSLHHSHIYDEINFIVSGRGKYIVKDKEYEVNAGDVFLFLQNTVHRLVWVDSAEKMKIIKVHFVSSDLINSRDMDLYLLLVEPFYQSGADVKIPAHTPEADVLLDLAKSMLRIKAQYGNDNTAVAYLLSSCLAELRNFYDVKRNCGLNLIDLKNYDSIFSAVCYINEHYLEDISLDLLADIANMSKNSFIYHFKQYFGVTPYNYVLVKRIGKAVSLLRESKDSITKIAFSCGFNSTAAFNRQFLKITGFSPSQMIKNYRVINTAEDVTT